MVSAKGVVLAPPEVVRQLLFVGCDLGDDRRHFWLKSEVLAPPPPFCSTRRRRGVEISGRPSSRRDAQPRAGARSTSMASTLEEPPVDGAGDCVSHGASQASL